MVCIRGRSIADLSELRRRAELALQSLGSFGYCSNGIHTGAKRHAIAETPEDRYRQALFRASRTAEKNLGRHLRAKPYLDFPDTDDLIASVSLVDDGHCITLSTGIIKRLDALWSFLLTTPALTSGLDFHRSETFERLALDVEGCSDLSVQWLCLHELMHVELNHLAHSRGASLVEVGGPDSAVHFELPDNFPTYDHDVLSRCFEMQADSEATDVFLGPYRRDRWDELRVLSACLFAVMALMERENVMREATNISHPSAGTRFFTVLGHVFQMWLYPTARLERDGATSRLRTSERPDTEEFDAYSRAVLVPLINDAVMIASAAEAYTFIDDIGGAGGLLLDLFTIQYADELSHSTLKTNAARGWLDLIAINEELMTAAGHRS